MKITTNKEVEQCYFRCPLFATDSDGMLCSHPTFIETKPYVNRIITQDNSINRVPDNCPLKMDDLEMVKNIYLKKN